VVVASLSITINVIACFVCVRHCQSDYDDATGELFTVDTSLISVDIDSRDPDSYALYDRGDRTRPAPAPSTSTA